MTRPSRPTFLHPTPSCLLCEVPEPNRHENHEGTGA